MIKKLLITIVIIVFLIPFLPAKQVSAQCVEAFCGNPINCSRCSDPKCTSCGACQLGGICNPGDPILDFNNLYRQIQPDPNAGSFAFQSLNSSNPTTIGIIISALLLYLFPFVGLLLAIYIIYGGFSFIVASGDPGKIQSAYRIITNGLVGFAIIFTAYWITQIVGIALGLGDIAVIFNF